MGSRLAPGMDSTLARIIRRLEAAPWNRTGTDKGWVLDAMWSALRFEREVAGAVRVGER